MTHPSTHPSTLALHRMRYGELAPDEVRDIETHLVGCDSCRSRANAQENHRAAFELAPVPEALRGLKPARSPWRHAGWLVPALAAAMALVVVGPLDTDTGPNTDGSSLTEEYEETRAKGTGGALQVWIDDDNPHRLDDGAAVSPGDRVQLKYRTNAGWITFAGVDGRGVVEVYKAIPADGSGEWQAAPFALTMDDAPGEQIFYAVFTSGRPDREAVADALKSGKTAAKGLKIERVTLVNTASPANTAKQR